MNPTPNVGDLMAFYAPYAWFALAWLVSLAVACVGAGVAVRTAVAWPNGKPDRRPPSPSAPIALAALATFAAAYSALVMYHEDLVGLDYAQLTAHQFAGVPIWPDNGRFFPLGLQEYNLLNLIGRSPNVYHAFSVVELAAVIFCVVRILRDLPLWFRCASIAVLMVWPSFVDSFFALVYPERDIIVWLSIWILSYLWFVRSRRGTALVLTLVAAQSLLYYKETSFILLGGFAALRIATSLWNGHRSNRPTASGSATRRFTLELAHLFLCAVFLATYYFAVARHVKASYADARGAAAAIAAAVRYAYDDPLFDLFAIATIWSVARALVTRVSVDRASERYELDLFWDPLALASLAYGVAYATLGLAREYYLGPPDFIAVLYLARIAYEPMRSRPLAGVAGGLIATGIVWAAVRADAFTIVHRKRFAESSAALASFVKQFSQSHDAGARLFVAQVGGFQTMEFSAYLAYRGIRPATDSDPSSGTFRVDTPHRFPSNLCHPSQRFQCRYASMPSVGDLVVTLPGASNATALAYTGVHLTPMFQYGGSDSRVERVLQLLIPADRLSDASADAYVYLATR